MSKHSTPPAQKEAFAKWLTVQLDLRQWKAAELARRSQLTRAAISLMLLARSTPEPASCQKLASALGLPVDLVYEQAGYLGASSTRLSSPKRSLIELVKRLPEADASKLLARSQARMVTQADGKWWA
jgi:transcriptional regulator with XRE-family HTH domain